MRAFESEFKRKGGEGNDMKFDFDQGSSAFFSCDDGE
jgi:hypothetical protein